MVLPSLPTLVANSGFRVKPVGSEWPDSLGDSRVNHARLLVRSLFNVCVVPAAVLSGPGSCTSPRRCRNAGAGDGCH